MSSGLCWEDKMKNSLKGKWARSKKIPRIASSLICRRKQAKKNKMIEWTSSWKRLRKRHRNHIHFMRLMKYK